MHIRLTVQSTTMCTVTFLPHPKGVLLSSSRDEHLQRGIATPPAIYSGDAGPLLYPKDAKAGGSWFVINHEGTTGILLNGAFTAHVQQPPYCISRGLLLIELFNQLDVSQHIQPRLFDGIEPFTLILWEHSNLLEYRWNGTELYIKQLPTHKPHIWSSATLYNASMQQEREVWFEEWYQKHSSFSAEKILHFHTHTQAANKEYGIRMQRSNGIQSASITTAHIQPDAIQIIHRDLQMQIDYVLETALPVSTIVSNGHQYDAPSLSAY